MNVLLTGAFGNIGHYVLEGLHARGHKVTAFDLDTPANRRLAAKLPEGVRIIWGDLRDSGSLHDAVTGQDCVIHMAFVIPSLSKTGKGSEEDPAWSYEINVEGTRRLLSACSAQAIPPRFLFTSSLHVYGRTHDRIPPRTHDEQTQPIEHYAKHKMECERLVKASGLKWAIFRLGACLPVRLIVDQGMFEVPLNNRIEYVHGKDIALAVANGLETKEMWGRVWLIGGGADCQLYQRDLVCQVLETIGVGMLPEEAFTRVPFPTDWLDTEESQRVLRFQQHTLQDYLDDLREALGWRIPLIKLMRPLIRRWLLGRSPAWQVHKLAQGGNLQGKGGLAVVTGASSGIGKITAESLAQVGYHVLLVARSRNKLSDIVDGLRSAGYLADFIVADLTDYETSSQLFDGIQQEFGIPVIWVNNAGTAWYGFGEEMNPQAVQQMVQLNTAAVAALTLKAVRAMKSQGAGHIFNVGSIVGSLPSQGVALYSATKSFLDTFTTALYRELKGTGVRITVLRVGAVATDFIHQLVQRSGGMLKPVAMLAIPPERVARQILSVIQRPTRVAYIPGALRVVPWLEMCFGWVMDQFGPLLLKWEHP